MDVGFIQRPLFAASLWALLTWTWHPALHLGIFFELLWLDLFPAGTFIPPHALFALMTCICVVTALDDPNMRQTVTVVVASFPLAYLGAWLEQKFRTRHNLVYTTLLDWSRHKSRHSPPHIRLITRALTEHFSLFWGVFMLCGAIILAMVRMAPSWIWAGPEPGWPMLWVAASLGAILALRIRTAHALSAVCLLLALLANF